MFDKKSKEILLEIAIALALLFFVLFLFHENQNKFWSFDDGEHLNFATNHSIVDYFTNSSVVRLQSWANLTPWIFIFYKFNLTFFGLNSDIYYNHILIVIGISAIFNYKLLSLKFNNITSFFSSVFFLLGLPTAYVSSELMSAHYAYGLLFSIACLYFFIKSADDFNKKLLFLSCFFYTGAIFCKEIYVPLGLGLFFLQKGNFRERVLRLMPFLMVLILYMIARYFVFGRFIGGYNTLLENTSGLFFVRIGSFLNIPWTLSGGVDPTFWSALIYIFVILMSAFVVGKKKAAIIIFGAVMLCAPLYPLTLIPGLKEPNRYFFGLWWALSILISIGFFKALGGFNKYILVFTCVMFSLFLYRIQKIEFNEKLSKISVYQKNIYKSAINLKNNDVLIPVKPYHYYKNTLNSAINSYKNNNKLIESGFILGNLSDFCESIKVKKIIYVLNDKGVAINLPENDYNMVFMELMQNFPEDQKSGVPLNVSLELNDKYFLWNFGSDSYEKYSISLDGSDYFNFPKSGFIANGIQKQVLISVRFDSKERWTTFSPDLLLSQGSNFAIKWRGLSEIKTNKYCD